MAKSLRSKWKRKMRAVKRERYGAKELAKLKEMVAKTKRTEKAEKKRRKKESSTSVDAFESRYGSVEEESQSAPMDVDVKIRKFDKNLRDQFGNYPVWMNQSAIKKTKRLQQKKKTLKKNKKKR